MATATFDKEIIINDKAADIIIDVLSKPMPKQVFNEAEIKRSEEALSWLLSNSKILSTPKKN